MSEINIETFINQIDNGEIVISPTWQRDDRWNDITKWNFIQTMVEYPKAMLTNFLVSVVYDQSTGCELRLIADGHTRASAIYSVTHDMCKIPKAIRNGELTKYVGCVFSELPKYIQQRVRNYKLQIGEFDDPDGSLGPTIAVLVNQASKPMSKHEQRRSLYYGTLDQALRIVAKKFEIAGLIEKDHDNLNARFEESVLFAYWASKGFPKEAKSSFQKDSLFGREYYSCNKTCGRSLDERLSEFMYKHRNDCMTKFISDMDVVIEKMVDAGFDKKSFKSTVKASKTNNLLFYAITSTILEHPRIDVKKIYKRVKELYDNSHQDFTFVFKYTGTISVDRLKENSEILKNYYIS